MRKSLLLLYFFWVVLIGRVFGQSQTVVNGSPVFTATGYGEPWNGRQNGTGVPDGTYVYIIDLGNGTKPMTGAVMIIR